MNRATAWFVHAAIAATAGTGFVYAWMRYLCEPVDDFALANHPLEPDTKALHILLAPALVFAAGMLWRSHIWSRIRTGFQQRRRSGIALAVLLLPMTASGYLLQTAVDEWWREVWVWLHATTGIGWGLIYALHQLAPRSAAGAAPVARPAAAGPGRTSRP